MENAVSAPASAPNTPVVNAPPPGEGNQAPNGEVTEAKAQQPNPEQQLFEVKVNGSIKKMTLEQLKARAILADGAHEKFNAASEREKKYTQWKEKAQKDAIEALMDPELGLTKDQIRSRFETWYKENFIDPETMTPEQQRLAELERYRQRKEQEDKEREEMTAKQREEAETAQEREKLQIQIINILEKSNLPKTRFTANRIAYWMQRNIQKGYDAPEEVIVQQVKEEKQAIAQSLVAEATPEQVVEMLGEEVIKKLRKYDLERIKKKLNPDAPAQAQTVTPKTPREPKAPVRPEDVDRYLREMRIKR